MSLTPKIGIKRAGHRFSNEALIPSKMSRFTRKSGRKAVDSETRLGRHPHPVSFAPSKFFCSVVIAMLLGVCGATAQNERYQTRDGLVTLKPVDPSAAANSGQKQQPAAETIPLGWSGERRAEPSVPAQTVTTSTPVAKTSDNRVVPVTPKEVSALAAELNRLHNIDAYNAEIVNVPLYTAINTLCNAAHANRLEPDAVNFAEKVTVLAKGNPWDQLQLLSERYQFQMEFDKGIWVFYRPNPDEILVRTFQLHWNDLSKTKITAPSVNAMLNSAGSSGMGSGGGQSGMLGSSPFMGGGSANNGGVAQNGQGSGNGQNSTGDNISVDTDQIVKGIQTILKMPVTGMHDIMATDAQAAVVSALPPASTTLSAGRATAAGITPNATAGANGTNILYIPQTNRLVVWAPRQLMERTTEYLRNIDRPVRQLTVRIVYFEVSRDRTTDAGFDPTLTTSLSASLTQSATGPLNKIRNLLTTPTANIVNTGNLSLALQAMQTSGTGHIKDSATINAVNLEESKFNSGLSIPVINTSLATPSLSGSQTSTSTSYINVGIETHFLPRIIDDSIPGKELIRMNLTVSVTANPNSIILQGNPVPVLSGRQYSLPVYVHAGETIAIGGLVESEVSTNDRGIPVIGDVPILGWLFKDRAKKGTKTTLIAYITPILDPLPTFPTEPVIPKDPFVLSDLSKEN